MKNVEQEADIDAAETSPLLVDKVQEFARDIPEWNVEDTVIRREFVFRDFATALGFLNRVAVLAEQENHHPDMCISWNRVSMSLSTHKAGGLTTRDFRMAVRIDALSQDYPAERKTK